MLDRIWLVWCWQNVLCVLFYRSLERKMANFCSFLFFWGSGKFWLISAIFQGNEVWRDSHGKLVDEMRSIFKKFCDKILIIWSKTKIALNSGFWELFGFIWTLIVSNTRSGHLGSLVKFDKNHFYGGSMVDLMGHFNGTNFWRTKSCSERHFMDKARHNRLRRTF